MQHIQRRLLIVGVLYGTCFWASRNGFSQELPKPKAVIAFDEPQKLDITGAKLELVDGGVMGKLFKTNQKSSSVGWKMSQAHMPWDQATISFWIKPLDWSGQPRFRHWLYTVTPAEKRSLNLVVGDRESETEEVPSFQLMDLKGTLQHEWNRFSKWQNNQWYFVTVTWNKEWASLYLNGELDADGGGKSDISQNFKIDARVFKDTILYIGTSANWKQYDTPESTLMSRVEIRDKCLSAEDVRKLYYAQKPLDEEKPSTAPTVKLSIPPAPRVVVPADATAPTIGAFDDSQWADAAVICGLNDGNKGMLSDKPFVAYLKSDGKKFYLAFRSKVPDTTALVANNTAADSDTAYDDSWEIFIYPDLQTYDFYQAVVNSRGAVFDWYKKQTSWNGRWEIKQRIEAPNTWDVEAAIPLEDLGVNGDIDGKQWRFNLNVDQKGGSDQSYSWAPLLGLFEQRERLGILTFKKGAQVVGLASLGKPTAGIIALEMASKSNQIKANATLTEGNGSTTKKAIETPQKPVEFDPLIGVGQAIISAISPAGATPETADFYYGTIVPYDSVPLTIRPTNYPSRQQLSLEVNYGLMSNPNQVKSYGVDFGSGQQVVKRQSDIPWERFSVETARLKPGPYTCSVALLDAAGKTLASKQFQYIKDGAEEWLHNQVGIQKGYVPPPYTPIKIAGNEVAVIDRKIVLADTGLPQQITSVGQTLLTGPVQISGECDGQATELTATKPFFYQEIQPDDSVVTAEVKLGSLTGTLKQTISFDGLCWYELALSSASKAKLKGVALEIPLSADLAKYYLLTEPDYATMGIKEWEVSNPLRTNLTMPFLPHLYLGNDKAGFAWMAETQKGWQIAHDSKTISIQKRNDSVVLRVNFVDDPIDVSELKISFGIQPTPVKPVTERQQRITIVPGRWPEWPKETQVYGVYQGQDPSNAATVVSYAGLPEPANPELAHKTAMAAIEAGSRYFTPYAELTWLSLGLAEMKIYGGDWYLNQPWAGTAGSAADPEPFGQCDLENKDYQDFIVWRFVKNWDAYDGSSVYFDLFSPWPDKLPEHHRSYVTRSGRTAYPQPLLAMRNMARRLYIGYKQKDPNFAVFTHASNLYMPLIAFGDAWPVGENFSLSPTKYPEILTYERYHSWLYGYAMGAKTMFLPSLKSPGLIAQTELTNYLTGLVINHNTSFWTCFINQPIVLPFIRRYHGGDWPLQEFLSYWEHPDLTNLDPKKFKVSGWYNAKDKKGMLLIASLSATPVKTKLALGKGWTYSQAARLTNPISESEFGDQPMPAKFDGSTAEFLPYGVLMLEVQ